MSSPGRAEVAAAGHTADLDTAQAGWRSPDANVRAVALGALRRMDGLSTEVLLDGLHDESATVRRRAAELCGTPRRPSPTGPTDPTDLTDPTDSTDSTDSTGAHVSGGESGERGPSPWMGDRRVETALVAALGDPDIYVVDAAAWALGERETAGTGGEVVTALAATVTGHDDALAREAAVAALGAIGDERGLPAILVATGDKPAVRRRAVLALAPFEGPDVDDALNRALDDRDWQVRQAAEDLLGADPTATDADLADTEGTRPDWD